MRWTTKLPEKKGYYWVRYPTSSFCAIAHVLIIDKRKNRVAGWVDDRWEIWGVWPDWNDICGYEWSDTPLPKPRRVKEKKVQA